jgi:hypothetical protein
VESQADWITCSADAGSLADELREKAERWATEERANGQRVKPFTFYGYQGFKVGRVRLGLSGRGTCVQLSGDLASTHLDEALRLSNRQTRLDLAVTVQLDRDEPDLANIALCDYIQWWRAHGEQPEWKFVASGKGGETLTIGDRTSNYYLRIYDKWRESRDAAYKWCWRYELEHKGAVAASRALHLAASTNRPADNQRTLYGYCAGHGIRTPFLPGAGQLLRPGFRRRSDTDSTLSWLAGPVSAALRRVIDDGRYGDAIAALGLAESAEPDPDALAPLTEAPDAANPAAGGR